MKTPPKKGDRVFVHRPARRYMAEVRTEGTVVRKGSKYFYVQKDGDDIVRHPHLEMQVEIETWRQPNFWEHSFSVYPSEEDFNLLVEKRDLAAFVINWFQTKGGSGLSLADLRSIAETLKSNTPP